MKKPQYIFFDLDGTLTDPAEGITKSVAYALDYFGEVYDSREKLNCFIGPPLKESFMRYYAFDEEKAKAAVEKYREYFKDKGIFENLIYDGVPELLQWLKEKDFGIVLATSKPTVFAQKILTHFSLDGYFDLVIGSNLDNTRTDKAEVIRFALDALQNPNSSDCVMVGDRMHDIIGAKKNGLPAVGVTYGYGSEAELTQSGCDAVAHSVFDLQQLLPSILR